VQHDAERRRVAALQRSFPAFWIAAAALLPEAGSLSRGSDSLECAGLTALYYGRVYAPEKLHQIGVVLQSVSLYGPGMREPSEFNLRKTLILGAIVLGLIVWACLRRPATDGEHVRFGGETMGTYYIVKLPRCPLRKAKLVEAQSAVEDVLAQVNRAMSTWDPASEISRLNDQDDQSSVAISAGFAEVLACALELANASGGAFDPTLGPLIDLWGFGATDQRIRAPAQEAVDQALAQVGAQHLQLDELAVTKTQAPLRLNLSAVAKGYGVDRVASALRDAGVSEYMVDIGGEVVVAGKNPQGLPWRLRIEVPEYGAMPGEGAKFAEILVENCAIAGSGDYRNYFEDDGRIYSHIIDPRTGYPITNGVSGVTVIAKRCMVADGLATCLMVMDPAEGLALLKRYPGAEALILQRTASGLQAHKSPGFDAYVAAE